MKIFRTVCRYLAVFAAGLVFAVICFLAINAISKPFSTSEYCGSKCHEMNTAYKSWQLSRHYANDNGVSAECIDCHLPPKDKFFTHITVKAYKGAKDIIKHHFGGEYNVKKMSELVLEHTADTTCLNCHNNLLAKPASSAALLAHQQALNPADDVKTRCVDCHSKLHERQKHIYTP